MQKICKIIQSPIKLPDQYAAFSLCKLCKKYVKYAVYANYATNMQNKNLGLWCSWLGIRGALLILCCFDQHLALLYVWTTMSCMSTCGSRSSSGWCDSSSSSDAIHPPVFCQCELLCGYIVSVCTRPEKNYSLLLARVGHVCTCFQPI